MTVEVELPCMLPMKDLIRNLTFVSNAFLPDTAAAVSGQVNFVIMTLSSDDGRICYRRGNKRHGTNHLRPMEREEMLA